MFDNSLYRRIVEDARHLIVARFAFDGGLLEFNKAFGICFQALAHEGCEWSNLFNAPLPTDVDSGAPAAGGDSLLESHVITTRHGKVFGARFYREENALVLVGEQLEAHDKELVATISSLSSEMGTLVNQLRREQAKLKKAHAEITRTSRVDPLTGLLNRRAFFDEARARLSICKRHGLVISMLFMDLDHFKAVNDTWGHEAGDNMLRAFSHMLASMVREEDVLARLGGEEFIVLLPSQDIEGAAALGERVVEECARQAVEGIDRVNTVSVGAAQRVGAETLQDLLREADNACYLSKRNGRDRVTRAPRHGPG